MTSLLIGQLTHTWSGIANNNRAAVLNQLSGTIYFTNIWHGDAVWCHKVTEKIKGGTTDEAFQELWLLWEKGASVGVGFNNWRKKNISKQFWFKLRHNSTNYSA